MSHSSTVPKGHHYFVPAASHYSTTLSIGIFLMALGLILKVNGVPAGAWGMPLGALLIIYVLFGWFGEIISENVGGKYTGWEDRSYRTGMVWFIFSEVMFFACFFGVLYYTRRIALPELASYEEALTPYKGFTAAWPSSGPMGDPFTPMGAWGIPAINTLLLLTSGVTLTIAHFGLLQNNRSKLNLWLGLTILLGIVFLGFQAYEYGHAYSDLNLKLTSGIYGTTFYMLTGFHGFHVTIGTIMLIVVWFRCLKGHFRPDHHFAFEGVAWYWHFVDVVWLFLFIFVYWF